MVLQPDTLRRTPAFASLSQPALEALALCFRERRYAAGELLFGEGDPAASLFLVVEGELSASARVGATSRPFARIGPGQTVGESALCDPTPRTATVVAARASAVWEIGDDAVEVLRRAAPAAARALLGLAIGGVVRRLRQIDLRVERELEREVSPP